ncbi:MAG: TonB-dependent receptor [candidate division KSB1 bacterium]|jgi:outer membrane receptor protein involved in Fe transport|nr:TonB-dependent receptor [candidate division KSB1 bacterium]
MYKKCLFVTLILLVPFSIFASTTGKIVGVVKDLDTGDPLPGANVFIQGTLLGAATSINGYFSILNVPVGTHSVRAEFIGYQSMIKQNIAVSVGLTSEVNFDLRAQVLEGEAVVVTAEREMIRKDATNTNIIKTAEDIEALPARGLQEITSTVAGVVKQDNSNVLNVRGGRGNESAVYVDGVLVNDPYNFAVRAYIPNEAIEELSVQTGGFQAEYGEAMSGIIIMTTNSGTKRYSGTAQVITDAMLPNDEKALGTYSYGYNEYNVTLSGPVWPGLNHTFFFSGTRKYLEDGAPSWGWAENSRKPEQFKGGIVPGQSDGNWSYSGKLKLQLSKNMELKSSLVWTQRKYSFTSFWSGMNPIWLYNTEHAPQSKSQHGSFNSTFTQMLSPRTFYDLKFNYFHTFLKRYDRMFEDDWFKYGDPTYVPDPAWANNPANFGEAYTARFEPDFFKPGAQYDDYFKNKTTFWGIDFDLTHQQGKYNTFKLGFDYKYHTMRQLRILAPTQLAKRTDITELERYRLADIQFFGYDLNGNEVNSGNYLKDVVRDEAGVPISGYDEQEPYHPITMSGYIQDKIEFRNLILNLGLRYDRIDPNAWRFRELEAQYDQNGDYIDGTGMFGGNRQFDDEDTYESEAYDFISPRMGAAFPVSDRTVFHIQYGKFYQKPNLMDLYLSPFYLDAFVNRGGYFTDLENPNLKPERTTSYEVGFKQMVSNNASLQLTAFYKETEDLIQVLNVNTDVTNIAFSSNGDFGVVKGFDILFNLRRSKNISLNVNYEYQSASGTGSATNSSRDIAWLGGARGNFPKFTMPLNYEQKHRGSLNVDYRFLKEEGPGLFGLHPFENTGINLLFSFNSGHPYTRAVVLSTLPHDGRYDNNISNTPISAVNAELTPWNYRLDLKVDKRIGLPYMSGNLNVYLWVVNLLNTESAVNVWTTTGLPDQTGYLQTTPGQIYYTELSAEERSALSMREMDYINYGIPRQIRLGFRVEL